jgi:cyclopropane-fatty-acyl-phospholipid synthase
MSPLPPTLEPTDALAGRGLEVPSPAARRGTWSGRLARRLLRPALAGWRHGRLTVHLPDGSVEGFGPVDARQRVTLRIERERFFADYLLRGDLGAGESYVRGDWRVDDLPTFIELAVRNAESVGRDSWATALVNAGRTLRHALRVNTRAGSRRNIQAHYDLSNELFALFLDETMAYSSAVFESPDEPLEVAQRRKFDTFLRKLEIGPDDHVLEIGCGWGGFAVHAARSVGCRVTGITISEAQFALARRRVADAGLAHLVDIRLCDYRDLDGRYTRIVSIEMLEAIGRRQWPVFFGQCDRLLAPGGRIGLQVITVPDHRFESYARSADWIQAYVFPGSLLGSISGFVEAMRTAGTSLTVRHVDDIAPHYAETLNRWRAAFLSRLPEVRCLGFDDRFVRTWDFYLASCEGYFRTRAIADLQLVVARAGEA